MKLTGKCKQDFEEWYKNYYLKVPFLNEEEKNKTVIDFYEERESIQYGVYEDFFDILGIGICVTPVFPTNKYGWSFSVELEASYFNYSSRNTARTEAIKEANEIHNNL
jgi:hypothetical protein